jgi:hypothetical protein
MHNEVVHQEQADVVVVTVTAELEGLLITLSSRGCID